MSCLSRSHGCRSFAAVALQASLCRLHTYVNLRSRFCRSRCAAQSVVMSGQVRPISKSSDGVVTVGAQCQSCNHFQHAFGLENCHTSRGVLCLLVDLFRDRLDRSHPYSRVRYIQRSSAICNESYTVLSRRRLRILTLSVFAQCKRVPGKHIFIVIHPAVLRVLRFPYWLWAVDYRETCYVRRCVSRPCSG